MAPCQHQRTRLWFEGGRCFCEFRLSGNLIAFAAEKSARLVSQTEDGCVSLACGAGDINSPTFSILDCNRLNWMWLGCWAPPLRHILTASSVILRMLDDFHEKLFIDFTQIHTLVIMYKQACWTALESTRWSVLTPILLYSDSSDDSWFHSGPSVAVFKLESVIPAETADLLHACGILTSTKLKHLDSFIRCRINETDAAVKVDTGRWVATKHFNSQQSATSGTITTVCRSGSALRVRLLNSSSSSSS